MASDFIKGHGINVQDEMSRIQFGKIMASPESHKVSGTGAAEQIISEIIGVRLPARPGLWNIKLEGETISSISPQDEPRVERDLPAHVLYAKEQFLLPSLCHPHIHLDKCFLLSDEKYSDLEIVKGDFAEALELTTKAKSRFEEDDLLRRGRWLIQESIAAGVTCMRAFVEVDDTVKLKCLEAGLKLKKEFEDRCEIQICAFAQEPLFSGDHRWDNRTLFEQAAKRDGVDVIGTTPYVEDGEFETDGAIVWAIQLASRCGKHLDFHLDYNLDPAQMPMIWQAIDYIREGRWREKCRSKSVVFGHCTRLTLFQTEEWQRLREAIANQPMHFVGLPTSDLFMMGRPTAEEVGGQRPRGTLQIAEMIQRYNLSAAIGVNNVGNAFTPNGSLDPLSVASLAVGLYQAGTKADAELLFQCVSSRAKEAIGFLGSSAIEEGGRADFVLLGSVQRDPEMVASAPRRRKTIQEILYDPPRERKTIFKGRLIAP